MVSHSLPLGGNLGTVQLAQGYTGWLFSRESNSQPLALAARDLNHGAFQPASSDLSTLPPYCTKCLLPIFVLCRSRGVLCRWNITLCSISAVPPPPAQEILDSLAELYALLQEEDMWAGLWQKRCKFPETATAIAYEQHGFFEQVVY